MAGWPDEMKRTEFQNKTVKEQLLQGIYQKGLVQHSLLSICESRTCGETHAILWGFRLTWTQDHYLSTNWEYGPVKIQNQSVGHGIGWLNIFLNIFSIQTPDTLWTCIQFWPYCSKCAYPPQALRHQRSNTWLCLPWDAAKVEGHATPAHIDSSFDLQVLPSAMISAGRRLHPKNSRE